MEDSQTGVPGRNVLPPAVQVKGVEQGGVFSPHLLMEDGTVQGSVFKWKIV